MRALRYSSSRRLTRPAIVAGLGLLLLQIGTALAATGAPDQERLARIYQRPEFVWARLRHSFSEWVSRLLQWLYDQLPGFAKGGNYALLGWAGAGVIALLAVVGFLWVRRHMRRSATLVELRAQVAAADPLAMEAEASRLAAAGQWAEAIRQLLLTLLVHLDRRGVLPLDPARTNREVIRLLLPRHRAAVTELRRLLTAADEVTYGGRRASQPLWQEAEAGYRLALAALAKGGEAGA